MFMVNRTRGAHRTGAGLVVLVGVLWFWPGVPSAMATDRVREGLASDRSVAGLRTTPISKALPPGTQTIQAPDRLERVYQTLEGTHFSYRCHLSYTHASKAAAVELCEIDPVVLHIEDWPETEVIELIHGQVSITTENGAIQVYRTGDAFVLPQGFAGTWRQSEPLLKLVVRHPLFWEE